ncbi:MAG TPA: hypothetical protein VFQ42_22275 [Mycobacterium sp.]|nr:hypothetical protein [Mycobacterium sp.]
MSYPGSRHQENEWGVTIYSTADGTRPAAAFGSSITPAQNTYGTPVQLISGASMTVDCCEITFVLNSVGISGSARDSVFQFLVDPAGGTSYTSVADLVAGPAAGYVVANVGGGGVEYTFRYWLRAGTSVAMAAAVNSATVTAVRAFCRVRGAPSRPQDVFVGTYLDQFGVSLATSAGTTITPGGASDGTWTQIGSNATRPYYQIEFGYGINSATMTTATIDADIGVGDSSNKKIAVPNCPILVSSVETLSKASKLWFSTVAPGDGLWARSQSSTAADTNNSVAIYGVG